MRRAERVRRELGLRGGCGRFPGTGSGGGGASIALLANEGTVTLNASTIETKTAWEARRRCRLERTRYSPSMTYRFLAPFFLGASLVAGCAFPPPRYDFGSPATMANPSRGGPVGGRAIAADGKTQYALTAFTRDEACFLAQIDGPESQRVQGFRFELRGFESPEHDLRRIPVLASSRVSVKETSSRFQAMPSGGHAVPITIVETCFAKPTTVITEATRYMVISVDYDGTTEHDGVWQLAN